jgi:hypothetical protein
MGSSLEDRQVDHSTSAEFRALGGLTISHWAHSYFSQYPFWGPLEIRAPSERSCLGTAILVSVTSLLSKTLGKSNPSYLLEQHPHAHMLSEVCPTGPSRSQLLCTSARG